MKIIERRIFSCYRSSIVIIDYIFINDFHNFGGVAVAVVAGSVSSSLSITLFQLPS